MDNDALVEQVARAMCAANEDTEANWELYLPEARVALAIIRPAVIEECAQEAESDYGLTGKNIAANIRALAKPATGEEKIKGGGEG